MITEDVASKLYRAIVEDPQPTWREISSRELAKLFGVSLQSLANWRVRESGPSRFSKRRGRGNKVFYRRNDVAVWLAGVTGSVILPWQVDVEWLQRNGFAEE